jgi:hypothetical protein
MAIFPTIRFIKEDEQLYIENLTSRRVVNGPGQVVVPALSRAKIRKGITLSATEYARVRDTLTGETRSETGPKMLFLEANETVTERLMAITLQQNQYVHIIDHRTGIIRVERGEQSVLLGPYEALVDGVRDGINIDEQNAVLIRSLEDGQFKLITEPQVFFPAANQEIVEVRKRILLEDHQTVVIRDQDGRFIFRRGTDEERSFFLQPYTELVRFRWSSGLNKEKRELTITHLDLRPKYMWYDFDVRTQDNVELMIGVTFFWQILDVERMVRITDDTTGDICAHARSQIIQSVSRASLERFLAEFNKVVSEAVFQPDDIFYDERGVRLLSVEVRYIQCRDAGTQRILQEIIQETTNRINRLQKQESENEIRVRQVQGEIDAEISRTRLLELQRANAAIAGTSEGESEAGRVLAFLSGLGDSVPLEDKMALFNLLRKGDILRALSEGEARLYFTPSEVDLSIDSR